ncbi:hypothetical protein [Methanosarcina sp.]|uniref:hypothetical protein n=1 Tax=Methanosarcina sp. TaxID=2213 RepID=UPI003C74214C
MGVPTYIHRGCEITVEYPENKVWQAVPNIQQGAGNEYEGKAEGRAEEPKKPDEEGIRYAGGPAGESCMSCLEMPEEQRKTFILEIQQVAEKILKAHGVINEVADLLKGEWFVKLQKSGFEKKLVLAKYGEEIFIGFYTYSEDVPIPDPNLVLLSQNGFWYPQRIEEKYEETVSSFFTGAYGDYDFLNIIPENVEKFQAFQRDFAKMLESQGWDSPDVEALEKIMPKN